MEGAHRRRLLILGMTTLILALVVAVAVAPARAASSAGGTGLYCNGDANGSVFDALGQMTARVGGVGAREPALRVGPTDSEINGKGPATSSSFTASIPVYFHVITNGAVGNVSDATIAAQMSVLNFAYHGMYGGADTGFSFSLAGIDRTNNAAWFDADPGSPQEFALKAALKRGGSTALNIYSTSGAQDFFLGWAYFPKLNVWEKKYTVLDGVIIHWGSMPGGPFGSAFSLGQTATHEVGHYLGLYHTFERGCQADGDRIDDTPAMFEPTSGCPRGKDTCPAPGLDPIHNYMDYSFDSCYEEFTPDQAARMQKQYLHWRLKRA